jgi:hypothetical protein
MKNIFSLSLFCFFSYFAYGAELDFIYPSSSPLKFSHADVRANKNYFSGSVTLSGVIVFEKHKYGDGLLWLRFIPDSKSRALLPHWKTHDFVKEIDLLDETDLIKKMLPEKEKSKVLSGELPSVEIEATITADDYMTTVDCDHLYYMIRTVRSIDRKTSPMPAKPRVTTGGC